MNGSAAEQDRLVEPNPNPVFINYREVQAEDLQHQPLRRVDEIQSFKEVLEGLSTQTGSHRLQELDLDNNAQRMVTTLLETYPDHESMFCAMLIDNFCEKMQTRARAEGKYVVLALLKDILILCHTDAKEKTVTKDANVIERLLDTDNVDKYIRFDKKEDGIGVSHFERHKTESITGWLGLPSPRELSYEDAGDIKIYSEIGDSTTVFQYSRDEFERKFLISEEYQLVDDVLNLPEGEYRVDQIKLGRRKFDSVDEFKQVFHSLYYELQTYQSQYESLANSMEPWEKKVIDREDKISSGPNGETIHVKENEEFNVIFANNKIELSASWRVDLVERFDGGTPTRLYHCGMEFEEDPVAVGPFEIYNPINVDGESLNQLYESATDFDSGKFLANLLKMTIFNHLSRWTQSPISHFFSQIAEKYTERLDAEGMVHRSETEVVEFKDSDWFATDSEDKLVEKMIEEIQDQTRLVVGGIDEREQKIRPLSRSRFDSERLDRLESKLIEQTDSHDSIDLTSVGLGGGESLLLIFALKEDGPINLDALGF